MNRINIISLAFGLLIPVCGCKSASQPPAPGPTTANPASQPVAVTPDAAQQENERFKREVEANRRKSKSADIDKTDAYRKYKP